MRKAWIDVTSYDDRTHVQESRDGLVVRFVPYSWPVENSSRED